MKRWVPVLLLLALVLAYSIFQTYMLMRATEFGKGYTAGQEAGYALGKMEGYDQGRIEGFASGQGKGYSEGREEGYDTGLAEGAAEGYTRGLQAAARGYSLRDPTYQEALAFLKQDPTDSNKYVEPTYVCAHFARDVGNNAEAKGIRCAFVDVRFKDSAHAIIAFNTTDRGLAFFEPRSDEAVRPVPGKPFYQCIEPKPGYYYVPPPYDDTIMDILVIW